MSSIYSTPHLGVNVDQTSVNTPHNWAQGDEDSNAADSAPNTGNLAVNVLLEETGPITRDYFLSTQIPTPPQSKSSDEKGKKTL